MYCAQSISTFHNIQKQKKIDGEINEYGETTSLKYVEFEIKNNYKKIRYDTTRFSERVNDW